MTTKEEARRFQRETANEIEEVENYLEWLRCNCPDEMPKVLALAVARLQESLKADHALWTDIAGGWKK